MSPAPFPDGDQERVRRRIEAWRRTGDLARLWPDVAAADLRTAHTRIRAVTEAVLRSTGPEGPGGGATGGGATGKSAAAGVAPGGSAPGEVARRVAVGKGAPDPIAAGDPGLAPAGEAERRALGVAAFQSGMGALLAWWIEAGLVPASPEAEKVLRPHLDHGGRRVRLLRDRLDRIRDTMGSAGIEPVVLKGLHTGGEYFPHPATRPAADIDLLVRPEERGGAAAALAEAGLTEQRRTRFADRSEWVPRGRARAVHSLELEHAEDPWSVDLHTSLERWYFRGLRRGLGTEAFRRTSEAELGGTPVRVLGQPDLTAFLALHASYELVKVRLVRLVELVLVVRRDESRKALDLSDLATLVEERHLGRFVYPALALAEALAPGTIPPGLLERTARRVTRRAHRVVTAVEEADMAPLTRPSLDAKLMWARGPRQLLLNLSEVALPSDEGLEVGVLRLQWRRLVALVRRRARWRAGAGDGTMEP